MSGADLRRLSKALAFVLRHDAERLQLGVDPEGFVLIVEVLAVLRSMNIAATEEALHRVAAEVDVHKSRYTIVDDAIRANYGHSLRRQVNHAPAPPPETLFHGTSADAKDAILRAGLVPMHRQYVHLTIDRELARQVGSRHGSPCVLRVAARQAHDEGIAFMPANRSFWLTLSVPGKYLSAL